MAQGQWWTMTSKYMKSLTHWPSLMTYHGFQTRQLQAHESCVGGCAKRFNASARSISKSRTASSAAQRTDWRRNNLGDLNKANDTSAAVKGWASLSGLVPMLVVQFKHTGDGGKWYTNLPHRVSVVWVSAEGDQIRGREKCKDGKDKTKHERWDGEVGRGEGGGKGRKMNSEELIKKTIFIVIQSRTGRKQWIG